VAADRRLIRGLLGPGRLTQRVQDLEQTRALDGLGGADPTRGSGLSGARPPDRRGGRVLAVLRYLGF
jgi:hypothetical protein